jgi:aspartyl-tRNA(Asn)/glutamyl-tRNA(Gln) amidotransferase subunit C
MKITDAELDSLARLARICLSPAEKEAYRRNLQQMLDYVALLDELDLADTSLWTVSPADGEPLRADVPGSSLPRDAVLGNAPRVHGPYFKVPKIIGSGPREDETGPSGEPPP